MPTLSNLNIRGMTSARMDRFLRSLPAISYPSLPDLPHLPSLPASFPSCSLKGLSAFVPNLPSGGLQSAIRSRVVACKAYVGEQATKLQADVRGLQASWGGYFATPADPKVYTSVRGVNGAQMFTFDPLRRGAQGGSRGAGPRLGMATRGRRRHEAHRGRRSAVIVHGLAFSDALDPDVASSGACCAVEACGAAAVASSSGAAGVVATATVTKAAATFLGYGVLVGSCLRSVPQIMRIWKKQSVEGISLFSNLAEMVAYTTIVAYNLYRGYPFASFGDTVMCLLQDVIILGLFVKFGTLDGPSAVVGGAVLGAFGCWVVSGAAGSNFISALQASSMLLLSLGSRLPQIVLNWRRGSTGELSLTTSVLNFTGNVVRLFTTMALTQDLIILAGTSLQTVLNGVLVVQTAKSNWGRLSGKDKRVQKEVEEVSGAMTRVPIATGQSIETAA